jgi:hypothetical protein
MTLDDRLKKAVDSLGDKLRDEIAKELSSLNLAPPEGDAAIGRLAGALCAMDVAGSLSGILEALATAASKESARTGVFLLSGGRVRSFRLVGFPARVEGAPVELPLARAGVIADAIRQQMPVTSTDGPFDQLPPDVKAIAVPLVLAGAPIGALYAEGGDAAILEILTRFASRALEALTALKTARAVADGQVV